eukprot:845126_1
MGLMNAFDSQTEDSSPAIGRNLRSRPLARKKLSEMVEEELEQMIRRREFGEGEQLPSERELMAFFNVGRPSVREALAALKRKGLVQINNGELHLIAPYNQADAVRGLEAFSHLWILFVFHQTMEGGWRPTVRPP